MYPLLRTNGGLMTPAETGNGCPGECTSALSEVFDAGAALDFASWAGSGIASRERTTAGRNIFMEPFVCVRGRFIKQKDRQCECNFRFPPNASPGSPSPLGGEREDRACPSNQIAAATKAC